MLPVHFNRHEYTSKRHQYTTGVMDTLDVLCTHSECAVYTRWVCYVHTESREYTPWTSGAVMSLTLPTNFSLQFRGGLVFKAQTCVSFNSWLESSTEEKFRVSGFRFQVDAWTRNVPWVHSRGSSTH